MKRIIITVSAVLLLAGCSDFLNIRPEGTTTSEGLDYTKGENIIKPISAAYAELRSYDSSSFPLLGCLGVTSDDQDKGSTPEDGASTKEMDEFKYDAANELISAQWTGYYNIVSAANNAISQMGLFKEQLSSDDLKAEAEQGIGDAKFIRAFAYFRIVTMWGNVPIIDKIMTSEELAAVPQSTPDQVYALIVSDLEDAIARLPEKWPKAYTGRVTKYSAMALLAKVYLYRQNWNKAAQLCDQVIASGRYGLLENFRELFAVDGEFCKESLFEIESTDLGKSSGDAAYTTYAYVQGPRNNTPNNMQGWGFGTPSQSLIDFYTARGEVVRPATTLLYSGTTTPEGDYISNKCPNPVYNGKVYTPKSYNDWSGNGYGYDHNLRVIRYAEVLLIYAEAISRGAPVGALSGKTALEALNEVRDRAGLAPETEATTAKILDERRAELALEEDRFLDLVRTGRAEAVLGELGYEEGKNNLFPIPSTQLQLNENLNQNPNY
ncbi:MAG: RagB/SusD family nutrient uptake outer membrane protein [Bacteroidales bacterium]|nr:RagB/SusD family nutrient uptake outer membrane protein [Bacteroidales bacterium]